MPGSNNFLAWDPPLTNAESDAAYLADPTRTGGALVNQIFPAALANKAFHQATIMAAALGQMLAAKGYAISDADQNALAAELANIITNEDITALGILTSANLPLSQANGGTGAASLVAAGIPQVVASVDLISQTSAIGATTLLTPAAPGLYRLSVEALVATPTGTSTLTPKILWTQGGNAFSFQESMSGGTSTTHGGFVIVVYSDGSTPIQYQTLWASGGGGDSYDLHVRLEKMS